MSAFLGVADVMPLLGVMLVSALGLVVLQTRYRPWEFQVMLLSFAMHVVFTIFKLWLIFTSYGGIGDSLGYFRRGEMIATLLRQDFLQVFPQVLRMIFHQEYHLDVYVGVGGLSTQTITALTGLFTLVVGDSLVAVSVAFAAAAFFGKVALYQAFKELFERKYHRRLSIAALLVPSVAFWSAGIIKESIAMVGVAIVFLGVSRIMVRQSSSMGPANLALVAMGAVTVGLTKAYLLFTFVLGIGAWFYWQRAVATGRVRLRPLHLVLGFAVGIGGLLLLGELFPRYSIDSVADVAADMQFYAERGKGGSTYAIGSSASRSLAGQMLFAPLALFTALYRPLIFEAHNFQAMLNALETTTLLGITVHAVWKRSLRGLWERLKAHPPLMFCLVFAVVLGVMTGLTSVNLGTLSRYRMPLVPFFVAMTLVVTAPGVVRAASKRRTRASAVRGRAVREPAPAAREVAPG